MKYINGILVFLLIVGLSCNYSLAIVDSPGENAKIIYSNDLHSKFSLSDCVGIALKNNPSIRASVYNSLANKSKIGQAWANYFPQLSAGLEVSRTGNSYRGIDMPMSGYYTMGYIPTVSANMLLFDFGKTKANADKAKRTYEASKADLDENVNSVIYGIKTTYFNILFAEAQVRVYEDTVKDYELQLNQAQGFYRLGKKAKIDVVTAEYNLGKAKLNLVKAKNILDVARVQLSKIMGIPEYTNYELTDDLILNNVELSIEEALETALNVRPELISAKKTADAAMLNLRSVRRSYTPNIGVYGSYGNGIGSEYNLMSSKLGVGMNYSSLNIMLVKKQIDEAKAKYQKSLADYENTKNSVYLNVKKNYMDLQTAKEQIIISKLALDQAKEQYRQVTGRYKAGVGDAIELKDGENTYLNARLDFYNSMLNYNNAAASLEKEIGLPLVFSPDNIIVLDEE